MNSDEIESQNQNPVDPIDLSIFKEHIQHNLFRILDSLPKVEKSLVIEKSCLSRLFFFVSFESLKERQIRSNIIALKSGNLMVDTQIILYVIPPKKELVQIISKHIEGNVGGNSTIETVNETENWKKDEGNKEYHVIFIPKITNECQTFIKESNYCAYFFPHNLNIDIYGLDYELMSIEEPNSFYELYVCNNNNSLSSLERAIIKYETVFGKIKHKYYKGDLAKLLKESLDKDEEEINFDDEPKTFACIMFDRSIDMITPFCSQFVYEGLLDENFNINFNSIKVPPKLLEKESKQDIIKVDLSSADKFYTNVKDYNFNKIKEYLPVKLAEQNKVLEDSKKTTRDLNKIQGIIENVKKIREERVSLTNHINLADHIAKNQKLPLLKFYLNFEQGLLMGDIPERINEFIQDELSKKAEEYDILKIICLYSLTHSGLKHKIFDQIKKEFLNVYGFQEIFLWRNLEKLGIVKIQDNLSYYNEALKKLNLIFEDVNSNEPNDPSYAYNGYCPITLRLIETAISKGWGSIRDLLKKIPGEFDFPLDEGEMNSSQQAETQFILLVFIGGLTYGELAGIRYLNKKLRTKKFIVLTTEMINSKRIFNNLKQGKYAFFPKEGKMVLSYKDASTQF